MRSALSCIELFLWQLSLPKKGQAILKWNLKIHKSFESIRTVKQNITILFSPDQLMIVFAIFLVKLWVRFSRIQCTYPRMWTFLLLYNSGGPNSSTHIFGFLIISFHCLSRCCNLTPLLLTNEIPHSVDNTSLCSPSFTIGSHRQVGVVLPNMIVMLCLDWSGCF